MAMDTIKKNISLVVGISIPILMIAFVAASIYLPQLLVQPKYNFIYALNDSFLNQQQYSVQGGKLIKSEFIQPDVTKPRPLPVPQLYMYDVAKNESSALSFEEAQNLNIHSSATSPDGFEVVSGSRSNGFFPFFYGSGSDYYTKYLKGHGVSQKLTIGLEGLSSRSYHFLGWIQ